MLNEYSAVSLLEQHRELDEHPRLKAKSGSQIGASVMQTVCTFANEPGLVGGYILLNGKNRQSPEKKFITVFTTVGKSVYNLFTTHPLQHHLVDRSLGRKNRLSFALWRFFHF
jgi:hypothetical protein